MFKKDRHELFDILKGLWLLYGESFIGKSMFCARLCKKYFEMTEKKGLYLYSDLNLRGTEYGKGLMKISNAEWKLIDDINSFFAIIDGINMDNHSIIVVDSLSGIFDELLERFNDLMDLRINVLRSRVSILLSRKFKKSKIPIILVAHPTPLIKRSEFFGENDRPRIPLISLINYDGILKFFENEGKRYIKIVRYRSMIEGEYRGKIYDVDQIVG